MPDYQATVMGTALYQSLPAPLQLSPVYAHVHVFRIQVSAPGNDVLAKGVKSDLEQYVARADAVTGLQLVECSASKCSSDPATHLRVRLQSDAIIGSPQKLQADVTLDQHPGGKEGQPRLDRKLETHWVAADRAQLIEALDHYVGSLMLLSAQVARHLSPPEVNSMAVRLADIDSGEPALLPHAKKGLENVPPDAQGYPKAGSSIASD